MPDRGLPAAVLGTGLVDEDLGDPAEEREGDLERGPRGGMGCAEEKDIGDGEPDRAPGRHPRREAEDTAE